MIVVENKSDYVHVRCEGNLWFCNDHHQAPWINVLLSLLNSNNLYISGWSRDDTSLLATRSHFVMHFVLFIIFPLLSISFPLHLIVGATEQTSDSSCCFTLTLFYGECTWTLCTVMIVLAKQDFIFSLTNTALIKMDCRKANKIFFFFTTLMFRGLQLCVLCFMKTDGTPAMLWG